MLVIYTSESRFEEVLATLTSVEGLSEVVKLVKGMPDEEGRTPFHLRVDDVHIHWPLSWHNLEPPLLFPPTPFEPEALLCLVMTKLGHLSMALTYCSEDDHLAQGIRQFQVLLEGGAPMQGASLSTYYHLHNRAVIRHYAGNQEQAASLYALYRQAIQQAPSREFEAFSARQFATCLADARRGREAEQVLRECLEQPLPPSARHALKFDLVSILSEQLAFPFDPDRLSELKELISDGMAYFEARGHPVNVASLLVEASGIANIEQSYSEALGYIQRAINLYADENMPEHLATAFFRKGTLLYTWAQNGNPQFFKQAIETYQEALKVFRKDTAPAIFAEIHHNLGVIYAEMPIDHQRRGIWAALSATSFKESLEFFTKEAFPYNYAMIANNYANALMKYPEAKQSDQVEKALEYYREALQIRTAEAYPYERVHTLLNYLEACWRAHNEDAGSEQARHEDMMAKAREILHLTQDPNLIEQAQEHLAKLQELKQSLLNA